MTTILEFGAGGAVGLRAGGLTPEEVHQLHTLPATSDARDPKATLRGARASQSGWRMIRYSDNDYAGR